MPDSTHGVVVIHGVGDGQERGVLLGNVTNGLADSLQESAPDGSCAAVRRQMDISANPPSATLDITAPDGTEQKWVFKEAFWADAFPAPPASVVLRWLFKQQPARLRYIISGWFKDPANNERYKPDGDPENPIRANAFLTRIYRIQLFVVGLVMIPLSFLLPFFFALIWPLYWLPNIGPLQKFLKWLHSGDVFLSGVLGDTQSYLEDGMRSASVRGILERVVIAMLNDEYGEVEDITIIAHSMGCVVTFDALTEGGEIARAIRLRDEAGKPHKKITFVSVGSGINSSIGVAQESKEIYAKNCFSRPFAPEITGLNSDTPRTTEELRERFFWLDLYARFDPVPAGDLNPEIEAQAKIDPGQIKRRRVVNLDNPLRDHSYYWRNRNLVMPRIARAINGGTDYPWPEVGITEEKVRTHLNSVMALVSLRLLLAVLVLSNAAFLFWSADWRSEALERAETVIIRLPAVDSFYCQTSNGVLHSSKYEELTGGDWRELSPEEREARIQQLNLSPSQEELTCLLKTNFLMRDLGQFGLTLILAALTALTGLGLYQAFRAWKFGAIS